MKVHSSFTNFDWDVGVSHWKDTAIIHLESWYSEQTNEISLSMFVSKSLPNTTALEDTSYGEYGTLNSCQIWTVTSSNSHFISPPIPTLDIVYVVLRVLNICFHHFWKDTWSTFKTKDILTFLLRECLHCTKVESLYYFNFFWIRCAYTVEIVSKYCKFV